MKRQLVHIFEDVISVDNLLSAWQEFIRGKRHKLDVQVFNLNLMDNILQLHRDLANQTYRHGPYQAFNINDPKPRNIHKATVRDRLLHHAVYRQLYWFYHQIFIADSFSCQLGKGTRRALNRFRAFAYQVSANHTKTCWVLKCDIKKFFASIDQTILLKILKQRISNENILWLLEEVVKSFSTKPGIGLPLGNLTSQLLVNIHMNEFDQFVKHQLKVKHYIRYADDSVILSPSREYLTGLLPRIGGFLKDTLKLTIHPNKVFIKTLASGVDFLGWGHFSDHRVLRTATKRRMFSKIRDSSNPATLISYQGLLRWGNTERLQSKIFSV